jgi:hypothetical protein
MSFLKYINMGGIKTAGKLEIEKPIVASTAPKIDASRFEPMPSEQLLQILGLTIKKDEGNKLIAFLCQLSAYTESDQLNVSFNAPSSTGKSYIPTEIAKLFPEEDVIELAYCSPAAFFHDRGQDNYNKEKNELTIDLSRKILIFLDQPHNDLLANLRPMLSHDKKEIKLKITDKSEKGGLRTKNVLLRGFPSVIFCTAGLRIDEQESTRFILLSPETSTEKIREAIHQKISKEADKEAHSAALDREPERNLLKDRIRSVKQEGIKEIKINSPELIEAEFLKRSKILKPRHQRDIGRVMSLVKSFALLNLWFRQRNGSTIVATEEDILDAFRVWDMVSKSQELNLPPYVYDIFNDVILAAWNEKNDGISDESAKVGLSRQEITRKHYLLYGRALADASLRQQIIPMLEGAGLISQEVDSEDKRRYLIRPTNIQNIAQNYIEAKGGVKAETEELPPLD